MKDEINALIEDMYDILVCALGTHKYAGKSRLEEAIGGLENLANEVKGFVVKYNCTSQTSTSSAISNVTMMVDTANRDNFQPILVRQSRWGEGIEGETVDF